MKPTHRAEVDALKDIYEEGVNENEEENMVVFNSYDGFLYRSGHGREKCSKAELTQAPSPTTAASIHSGICRQAS